MDKKSEINLKKNYGITVAIVCGIIAVVFLLVMLSPFYKSDNESWHETFQIDSENDAQGQFVDGSKNTQTIDGAKENSMFIYYEYDQSRPNYEYRSANDIAIDFDDGGIEEQYYLFAVTDVTIHYQVDSGKDKYKITDYNLVATDLHPEDNYSNLALDISPAFIDDDINGESEEKWFAPHDYTSATESFELMIDEGSDTMSTGSLTFTVENK